MKENSQKTIFIVVLSKKQLCQVSAKKYIHFLKTKRVANENEKFPRKEKYL
jgi:hypothetical protein